MGKKKRYRLRVEKFGVKYAAKYGLNNNTEMSIGSTNTAPEPVIMAAPEPAVEEPVVAPPELATITATTDPTLEDLEVAPKKKAAPKKRTKAPTQTKATTKIAPAKKAATSRKTTRKRTTKAKTTT